MPESSIVVRPESPESPSYTAASRLRAAGLQSAVTLFTGVAETVPLPKPPHPVVLADYGAANGHNSLLPIGSAIEVLSGRIRRDQAVLVTHTDVAENDFTALFRTLADDPDSYLRRYPAAYASAVGRSFYRQILPSDSVTLAWSSWAIQWLSQVPGPVGDHLVPGLSGDANLRAAATRQAAADWHEFIAFRGRELVPDGRLMVLTLGRDDTGDFGMRPLIDAAHAGVRDLVSDGLITAHEMRDMVIPIVGRNEQDFVAPFAPKDRFEGMSVEHLEIYQPEDRFWQQFQADGNAGAFGASWAAFLRASVFGCLVGALAGGAADPRVPEFADRLERGIAARLAGAPEKMPIMLAMVVLAKNRPR